MLPPKRTIKNKPSKYSSGHFDSLATSLVNRDAVRPLMCSRSVPDFGPVIQTHHMTGRGLTDGIDQAILKHFNRTSRLTIGNPTAVARLIRARISRDQEELWVIALSAPKRVIGVEMLFRGTADSCQVHPRDIVRYICESNATSYIIAHNHPSGELEPSDQDWALTRKLVSCGELIEIPLIDHVVVTFKGHTSMASLRPSVFQTGETIERRLDSPSRVCASQSGVRFR